MEQQGTDEYPRLKPVQRLERPTDQLDPMMRSSLQFPGRLGRGLPPPLNFVGRREFRQPPPEARCHVPSGISGRYVWTGPVLEAYGIVPKFHL